MSGSTVTATATTRPRLWWGLFLTIGLPILAILYPYIRNYKHRRALINLPGKPIRSLLLGNIPDIPKNRFDQIDQFLADIKNFGEKGFSRFIMGPYPVIAVYGPDAVREILASSKHSTKNFIYDALIPWLGTGLLTSNGTKWKHRRRLTTPAFHFEVLQRFLDVMNEQSEILIERIGQHAGKEKFEVFDLITACALDIICETAMGKKVHAQSATGKIPYVDAVFTMSHCVVNRIENPWLLNDFIHSFTQNGKTYKKCLKELHEFTLSVIRERKALLEAQKDDQEAQRQRRPAFLDILLTAEVEGQPLTDEDIREEVDTFMFEGHDTTSASLAWTIHLIGSHPEVQRRLQEEVDEVLGNEKQVTTEHINQLRYLEMVVKESLRLYPSVPIIGRKTTEEIQLGGYTIPKDTNVNISIVGLHRNPHLWDRPNEFDPERWAGGEADSRDPFLYVPFSAGPRNCIGQKFAQNEEKLILAKILKNFTITSTVKDPRTFPEVILRPNDGIWIQVDKRSAWSQKTKT